MIGKMRLIGIDPGLRHTGWGVIDMQGTHLAHVANGTIHPDVKAAMSERLRQLHDALQDVIRKYKPCSAAVETTFVNRDAKATLKLGQARGVVLLVPAREGLDVAEYAPNQVKKTLVGAGHADKRQIQTMVNMLLPGCAPDTADAADALAIAITHAHQMPLKARMAKIEEAAG